MPAITFDLNGRIRLNKKTLEKFSLVCKMPLTIFADPANGRLVLVPANVLPTCQQTTTRIEDWQYTQTIEENDKIAIPTLLRTAMGWNKNVHLRIDTDASRIYIYKKANRT